MAFLRVVSLDLALLLHNGVKNILYIVAFYMLKFSLDISENITDYGQPMKV